LRLNVLSEEEAIPKNISMLLTSDVNDVSTNQVTIDTTTTLRNGGTINPLKVSNIENTQNVRLLFQSLATPVSGMLHFVFKARAGTTWNFSIISTSTFSGSATAIGDWQIITLSGSFGDPFILKISNTTLTQNKETIWLSAFNLLTGSPNHGSFDQPMPIAPPSIIPLTGNKVENFTGKLTKPIPTMESGTILLRLNTAGAYQSNQSGTFFSLVDSTNTRGISVNVPDTFYQYLNFFAPTSIYFYSESSSIIYNTYSCSWQYDPVLNTTKIDLYIGSRKQTRNISGKIDFLNGLTNLYIGSIVCFDLVETFPIAEIYAFDHYIPETTISLMRSNKISDIGEKPIFQNSLLYTQSKGYLALPLGFNASEGVIGTAKIYNGFANPQYDRVLWPGFASKMPKPDNNTGESYIRPTDKKTLIAYGGSPVSLSYSFDLSYFNNLYSMPNKKWVNSYFELMPIDSEENKYNYKAFWWNSELLQLIKAWDIKPNSAEAVGLIISEDLSSGTAVGTAMVNNKSITLQNSYKVTSFSQVPSESIWNYNNVAGASIVSGALRLTPKSDAYYTDSYPKGLELSFPINDRNFVVEAEIGIPSSTYYYTGRAGISFIDSSNVEVGFAGFYDTQYYDNTNKYASIKGQTWNSGYGTYSSVKIKVERVNQIANVYIDNTKVLSNIYWPDNIVKIIFSNTRHPSYSGYGYMDIKNLQISGIQITTEDFTRISPEYPLQLAEQPSSTSIVWYQETNATGSAIEVYTNVFNGANWLGWKQCANGGQIPDLNLDNLDWPNVKLQTKQVLHLPASPTNPAWYSLLSDLTLTINTSQPGRVNRFVKSLNKVFIGWPEGTGQAYTDYIGVAKADPISLSYKLNNDCVYVKIDGKLTKQRAIRIPYQYIRTLDKRNALVGFCKPEEWEAVT